MLSPAQQAATTWLPLTLVRGLSPRRQHQLVRAMGTPHAAMGASVEDVASIAGAAAAQAFAAGPDQRSMQASLAWLETQDHGLITWSDPEYPALLREIPDPPLVLFFRGRTTALSAPAMAIVGSRNCTPHGARDAESFAAAIASQGYAIVSGLAAGIDTAAHHGALRRNGRTIAVMGTGPDIIYPATNRALAERIVECGVLLTEFAPGTAALPGNFPRRNRLISGLSRGVLVVEAAARSGSLITARFANDQGRDVFAVPGSIHSPHSKGCHDLIRQGAVLAESAQDVLREFGHDVPLEFPAPDSTGDLRAAGSPLLEALGQATLSAEELCECSGMPVSQVLADLARLQLEGRIVPAGGGRYQVNQPVRAS